MNLNPVYVLSSGVVVNLDHLAAIVPVSSTRWDLIVQHKTIHVTSNAQEMAALAWALSCRALQKERPC